MADSKLVQMHERRHRSGGQNVFVIRKIADPVEVVNDEPEDFRYENATFTVGVDEIKIRKAPSLASKDTGYVSNPVRPSITMVMLLGKAMSGSCGLASLAPDAGWPVAEPMLLVPMLSPGALLAEYNKAHHLDTIARMMGLFLPLSISS